MKKKVITIILSLAVFLFFLSPFVYADDITDAVKEMVDGSQTLQGASTLATAGAKALGIAQIVGTAVATIMLVILAIRYMYSSVHEKAAIKEKLIPYLIGAILLYASAGILQIIKEFIN